MKAKKSYGQHFLVNESLVKKIVATMEDAAMGLPLLEVGPGRGALTKYFYQKEGFKAIEADRDMVEHLVSEYPEIKDRLVQEDFLKVNLKMITEEKEHALVGNFPYNISTQIVFRLLENVSTFPSMVGMFQKEVSDRILSDKGTKIYGILSVLTALFYEGKTAIKIAPGSFSPPPKVNSSVIVLKRKEDYQENLTIYPSLKTVCKLAFQQRRKMLRSSLKSILSREILEELGFAEKRPEQLSVEQFILIAESYKSSSFSKKISSSS